MDVSLLLLHKLLMSLSELMSLAGVFWCFKTLFPLVFSSFGSNFWCGFGHGHSFPKTSHDFSFQTSGRQRPSEARRQGHFLWSHDDSSASAFGTQWAGSCGGLSGQVGHDQTGTVFLFGMRFFFFFFLKHILFLYFLVVWMVLFNGFPAN